MSTQNLTYYFSLPYAVEILPISSGEGGGYTACIPCLGRYSAAGDSETPEAAYAALRAALPSLITGWLAQGVAIPEPSEGVSINQFITTTLAQEVGSPSGH